MTHEYFILKSNFDLVPTLKIVNYATQGAWILGLDYESRGHDAARGHHDYGFRGTKSTAWLIPPGLGLTLRDMTQQRFNDPSLLTAFLALGTYIITLCLFCMSVFQLEYMSHYL